MRSILRRIVALAASLAAPWSAAQDAVREAPAWTVGDRWRFVDVASLGSERREWDATVARVSGRDHRILSLSGGKEVVLDGALNPRGPAQQVGAWPRFRFPLAPGEQWTLDREFGRDAVAGNETSAWKVEGVERITVPAGQFDCVRIAGESFRSWTNARSMNQSFNKTRVDETAWYCPAVKWFARRVVRSQEGTASPAVTTVTELLDYAVAR